MSLVFFPFSVNPSKQLRKKITIKDQHTCTVGTNYKYILKDIESTTVRIFHCYFFCCFLLTLICWISWLNLSVVRFLSFHLPSLQWCLFFCHGWTQSCDVPLFCFPFVPSFYMSVFHWILVEKWISILQLLVTFFFLFSFCSRKNLLNYITYTCM